MKHEKQRLMKSRKISAVAGGLLVIFLAVFLSFSIYGVRRLMECVNDIQNHPFRVINAGCKLQGAMDNVQISLKQLENINTPQVVGAIREQAGGFYDQAQAELEVIRAAYLGDAARVSRLEALLGEMRASHADFLSYAEDRTRSHEEIAAYAARRLGRVNEQFYLQLEEILEDARARFGRLYGEARKSSVMSIVTCCLMFAGVLIVLFLYRHLLKLHAARLVKQNQLFDLFSKTIDHVFMITEAGHPERNIISENAGRILGFSPQGEQISPAALAGYMNEEDRRSVLNLFQDREKTYWKALFRYKHPSQSEEKVFELQTYRTAYGGGDCMISTLTDETRKIRAREQLEAATQRAERASLAKSEFLSRMSHEIRTPMNGIIGMAAIAEQNIDRRDRLADCLRKINLSSKHLLALLNDVLDMSKIESGRIEISHEPFDFKALVESLSCLYGGQAREKGIGFRVTLKGDMEEQLCGDALRLNQILSNLLSNALKFTPRGGEVGMRVTRLDARDDLVWLRFEVMDSGDGIAPENYERIFMAFEQENAGISQVHGGTGLGLSISRQFAHMMGGDIRVSSRPGQGTVFAAELPFGQMAVRRSPRKEFQGLNALVVEGALEEGERAARMLERLGFRVDRAGDGQEASAMVWQALGQRRGYALCLMDAKAPMLSEILEMLSGRDIKRVLLTDSEDGPDCARRMGADAALTAPVFESTLAVLLLKLCAGSDIPEQKEGNMGCDFGDKRFLVVEDNEINLEIAMELLSATGARLESARNGQEAVDKFAASPRDYYDLILMDIRMAVMDGYQATQEIRAMNRGDAWRVPILAMTANAFSEDAQKSLSVGMNGHLTKPIDLGEVMEKINQALEAV